MADEFNVEVADNFELAKIGKPNFLGISGMSSKDLIEVREMWIAKMLGAKRKNKTDVVLQCLEWIDAMTSAMRMRGSKVV